MSAICTPMPADLIVRGGPNSGDRCDHGPIELRIGSSLEVADIFRAYGDAYRATYRLSGQQLRVMQAIETCRTAAFGGHRSRCNHCGAEVARYPLLRQSPLSQRLRPTHSMESTQLWVYARPAFLS
jgi:hypothetical protein